MKKLLLLLVVLMCVSLSACDRKQSNGLAGGTVAPAEQKPAPDVQITALNGTPLKLSDLRGKVVMLNFWATWCPPCREEIPSMMKLNSAMAGKPFQMVAVSIDEGGKPAIEDFFRKTGFTLPTYVDPTGMAGKSYGITGVPETFIIDRNGVLVKKVIGPMAWDAPEVTAYLAELLK